MNSKAQRESSTKLLSRRESALVPGNQSADETVNISVVKTELLPLTGNPYNELRNRNLSKSPLIFEPLDEDGERYLQEHLGLPPIDLTTMPTQYYINPHPTESIMSSGANSANEWWDRVDYSDEEAGELECARNDPEREQARRYLDKSKEAVHDPPEQPVVTTFPKTLEMQQQRKVRELQEEEENRAEIIYKLEKQMVSLYNLKKQYKKTLVGEGCAAVKAASLPPVGGVVDDKLLRERDLLLYRIKRKKLEDEVKKRKQIERKINIVKTLLNEQKQKEKELKRRIKEVTQLTDFKQKKIKEESRTVLLDRFEETSNDLENTDLIEAVEQTSTELAVAEETDLDEAAIETQLPPGDVSPTSDDLQELQSPEQSPRKTSKNKNARKKKSSEASPKKDKKTKKEKKKKDTKEIVEAPAICEPPPELPASQVAELSHWFENWRETYRQEIADQLLPDEREVALKPPKIVFKDVVAGRRTQQVAVVTNMGLRVLQCQVVGVQRLTFKDDSPVIQASLSGPRRARTGQSWSLTVTLDPQEGAEDGWAEVLLLCCRGEVRTRLSVGVQVLTAQAQPTLGASTIRFGPQMFWCGGPFTKHLQLSNPGGLSCLVYWAELEKRISPLAATESLSLEGSLGSGEKTSPVASELSAAVEEVIPSRKIAKYILKTAFKNVFRTFRIDSRQPLVLRPKSQVSLPVKFVPTMSDDRGDVFTKYRFCFEGENGYNEFQDLVVCGKIERSHFRLETEVVNMKLCYVGGTVQQARLLVLSSARHACRVAVRVPRSLASAVAVVPRSAVLAANSYVSLSLRLVLGWDFLDKPCCYLDTACGLLMFPVTVWVTDVGMAGAPPLEATVVASVAPPCPLSLAPPVVELGTVTTMETAQAELVLTNHYSRSYSYAFVGLPQSIMIEPGGGTGSILPLETVKLKLLFSPRAQDLGVDCGRPGGEGEVNMTLRCFTTISLASPVQKKHPQNEDLSQQELLTDNSGISSNYTVNLDSSRPTSKRVSRSGSLHNIAEDDGQNDHRRKVTFQERSTESIQEGSFVYVPVNNYENGMEDAVGEEEEGEEEDDEDYLTISEIKEEIDEPATEDLWDFYSTFQFDTCFKEEINDEMPEEETNQENEEVYETKSESSKHEVRKSIDNTEADKEMATQSVIKGGSNENVKGEDITLKENVGVVNDSENVDANETDENKFSVDEVDSADKSDSHDSGSEVEGEHERESKDVCLLPQTSQRFATLSVKAYVVDPLVELSSQTVVLPPTPCTSCSIAHIYLRDRPQRPCSIHKKITKFKTRFEFRSPSKQLTVEPKNGYISYKQSQKISLIYSPTLSEKDIHDKALEIKGGNLKLQKMQDMLNDYLKSKEAKQPKGKSSEKKKSEQTNGEEVAIDEKSQANDGKSKKGKEKKSKGSVESDKTKKTKNAKEKKSKGSVASVKTKKNKNAKEKKSKGSVASVKTKKTKASLKGSKLKKKSSGPLPDVVIDPSEVNVAEEDLKEAEMFMLKYLEPYQETITLLCLLETDIGDGNRRQETLRCEVLCSVVAPPIFLSTPACLDFGPVAVGTSSRMEATITNISFFDTLVRLSTLNPLGPFMCPAHLERPFWKDGELELPPEHILTVPIRFEPTESREVVEAFEVVSGSTVLHLQARGRGVPGSFTFHPDQEVFIVTSAAGKKADTTISITNTGEATLRFRICLEYLKEGQSLPVPTEEQAQSAATSPKQKKEPKREKKAKGLPEFTVLSEELEKCLENDFIDINNEESTEPVIKVLNADDNITVVTGETKQVLLRFTPPAIKQEAEVITSPKSAKGTRKDSQGESKKTKNKSFDKQDTSTVNTKLGKKGGKKQQSLEGKGDNKKESLSVKIEKKAEVKIKQIFAARFSVILADTRKVKDWVIIGTKK